MPMPKSFYVLLVAALLFLGVTAGAAATYFSIFPGTYYVHAFKALTALSLNEKEKQEEVEEAVAATSKKAVGVLTSVPESMQPGYTLYTSGHDTVAYLLNMDGSIAHEWSLPFRDVWPDPEHLKNPADDVHFRKARVMPNGDLFAIYEGMWVTPYGHGMVKMDKDSNLIWKYSAPTHHDFGFDPEGNIYVLIHEIRETPYSGLENLDTPLIEDFIVVLNPDGEEINRISLLEAFVGTPYHTIMANNGLSSVALQGNYTHANTIKFVDKATAELHPYASEGQLMISMRDLSMLALVDLEARKIVWGQRGPWLTQHDPDMLPNGNILLFDNLGDVTDAGRSRVIEFDPMTGAVEWMYTGTKEKPLSSTIRSSQHRLANGNTLITESQRGRLFEVQPDGEIVWEYVNPFNRELGEKKVTAFVCWGQRINFDEVPFLSAN
jgi:hypothetical protein